MEEYLEKMADACLDELDQIQEQEKQAGMGTVLGLLGAGALAGHVIKKTKDDWKLGRQVRKQQQY
jgi:hypothetical protein